MRRIAAALGLAMCLGACWSNGDAVTIVTTGGENVGCPLTYTVIDVVADPLFGTAIKGQGALKWPAGYTGRLAGHEVEVLDAEGRVVLTTGGRYRVTFREDSAVCSAKPCVEADEDESIFSCKPGDGGPL